MSYLPDVYQQFERAFPNVYAAHQELAKACYEGGPLDPRSARLVKLGVAIGAQAEGAVRSHARRALAEKMTPDEGPSRRSARPHDNRLPAHGGRAGVDRRGDREQRLRHRGWGRVPRPVQEGRSPAS